MQSLQKLATLYFMNQEKALREELVFQLTKGHAHMSFAEAVDKFPEEKMNEKFTNGDYTFWDLLEHIRRTQNDILEFIENPQYKDREWPKDYWPEKEKKAMKEDWDETVFLFHEDQKKLQTIIEDEKNDLYAKIPHGTGQ